MKLRGGYRTFGKDLPRCQVSLPARNEWLVDRTDDTVEVAFEAQRMALRQRADMAGLTLNGCNRMSA